MVYDVIIVGSGPAGISASLYAKRRKLSVLVISKGSGAVRENRKNRKLLWLSRGNFRKRAISKWS